jgi:hypothetical protein
MNEFKIGQSQAKAISNYSAAGAPIGPLIVVNYH